MKNPNIHQKCVLVYDWFGKGSEDGGPVQQQQEGASTSPSSVALAAARLLAAAAPKQLFSSPPFFSKLLKPSRLQEQQQQQQVAIGPLSARSNRARWAMAYPSVSIMVECIDGEGSGRSLHQQQQL
ncbi:hypothetical protein Vafri_5428 [Volvox africanus]|nr:hypothetical protein Vafri_5428 [Volvox africanus]